MPRDPTMRLALPCCGRALAGANARPIVDEDSVLDDAVQQVHLRHHERPASDEAFASRPA